MNTTIKKIMVPVDLKADSFNALRHASDLAVRNGAEIHLIHVIQKPSLWDKFFRPLRWDQEYSRKRALLANWKKTAEKQFEIPVLEVMLEGKICPKLLDYIITKGIDFVFMGLSSQRSISPKFSGHKSKTISRLSGVAVATIFHNSITSFKWKNVVVPVSNVKPEKRIRMLLHYAMLYNIRIHFVAIHGRTMDHSTEQFDLLVECIKLVKMFGNIAVDCKDLEDDDLTNAAWKYAKKIDADALITNSGNEICHTQRSIVATEQNLSEQIM
jgi:nucleotide-binding universal stress UspA family protein